MAGGGGLKGIKEHGRRIATRLSLDYFRARALSPNLQLVNCRCSKCVRCAQQDRSSIGLQYAGKLADSRGLAGTVDPHHYDDLWDAVHLLHGLRISLIEYGQELFLQQTLELLHVLDLLAVCLVPQLLQHFVGGRRAKVSPNKGSLQVIKCGAVNFLVEGNYVLDPLAKILASARDRLLHAV